jgi:hypothetical protein
MYWSGMDVPTLLYNKVVNLQHFKLGIDGLRWNEFHNILRQFIVTCMGIMKMNDEKTDIKLI